MMTKLSKILIIIFCFVLFPPGVFGGKQALTIRIWLFQGTLMEGQLEPVGIELIPLSSTPEIAALKALAAGPENAFKTAIIDALMEAKNLRTLDDLFLFKQTQREDFPFPGRVVLGRQIAYRVDLTHKVLSPSLVTFHVVLSKTKEGIVRPEKDDRTMLRNAYEATRDEEKMELILDQRLTLGFDDPVIVTVAHGNRPHFMVVRLTANEPEPRRKAAPTLKAPPMPTLVPAPQSVGKVLPSYPDELRRRGIKGEVGLRIAIDDKGNVMMVQVLSSLHAYLDYAASQAFWQWRFEPVLQRGKPVPAAFEYTFNFDPRGYAEEMTTVDENPAAVDEISREDMERILNGCAAYCRKLADAALFYICEETIKETTHALGSPDRLAELALRARNYMVQVTESADGQMTGWLVDKPQIIERRRAERLGFDCDYQMIRRFGEIEERRIVLKENGRRITDRVELLEESRYSALAPIASALNILAEDRQPLFHYRVLKEDKVFGKTAYVIEVVPKLGDADGVRSAKAWLEKGSGRILNCEIEGVPLDGYDDVLSEAVLLNIRPFFLRTYEYRVENSGVLLPDRTTVRIEYPGLMPNRRETKSKIGLDYKNFKFFSVQTGHEIIK
jgi:TonB family protein